jgi:hypothetical protein
MLRCNLTGTVFQFAGASIFGETPDLKTRPTCHSDALIQDQKC